MFIAGSSFATCGDDDAACNPSLVVVVVVDVDVEAKVEGTEAAEPDDDDASAATCVVALRGSGAGATPLGFGPSVLVALRLRWLLDDFSSDEGCACVDELLLASTAAVAAANADDEPVLVIDERC